MENSADKCKNFNELEERLAEQVKENISLRSELREVYSSTAYRAIEVIRNNRNPKRRLLRLPFLLLRLFLQTAGSPRGLGNTAWTRKIITLYQEQSREVALAKLSEEAAGKPSGLVLQCIISALDGAGNIDENSLDKYVETLSRNSKGRFFCPSRDKEISNLPDI